MFDSEQTGGAFSARLSGSAIEPSPEMSASQSQGQRSGEGSAGLWNYIREDDSRKEKEPDGRFNEDAVQQYNRDNEKQSTSGG